MRKYITKPTFYDDRFTEKIIQPDKNLIATFHALLDTIPNDKVALTIDLCVSELLRFHDPNRPMPLTAKELISKQKEDRP